MTPRLFLAPLAVAAALALGACAANTPTSTTTGVAIPTAPGAAALDPATEATETTTAAHDDTYPWGATYPGAIETTVTAPGTFTTSMSAMPAQNAPAWAVEITLTNTTGQTFNPAMLQIVARTGPDPAQQVFDHQQGYNGMLSVGPLPPGDTVTVPLAFTDGDGPKKIIVASMDGQTAITFTDPDA